MVQVDAVRHGRLEPHAEQRDLPFTSGNGVVGS
jgi:hypothetical protein